MWREGKRTVVKDCFGRNTPGVLCEVSEDLAKVQLADGMVWSGPKSRLGGWAVDKMPKVAPILDVLVCELGAPAFLEEVEAFIEQHLHLFTNAGDEHLLDWYALHHCYKGLFENRLEQCLNREGVSGKQIEELMRTLFDLAGQMEQEAEVLGHLTANQFLNLLEWLTASEDYEAFVGRMREAVARREEGVRFSLQTNRGYVGGYESLPAPHLAGYTEQHVVIGA